jgi:hypothetical protein
MMSRAQATYFDQAGMTVPWYIGGDHRIINQNTGGWQAGETVNTQEGAWIGTLSGIPGAVNNCYDARISAHSLNTVWSTAVSPSRVCWAPPPPPPPPPPIIAVCEEGTVDCPSPIVLNMGRGDYHLTDVGGGVQFDLDADGRVDSVSWTAAGEPLAFLALDRNGNGVLDNGGELFGDHTRLAGGMFAKNGFEALRELDSNGDDVVDSRDSNWKNLQLWIDSNHNGTSEPSELRKIAGSSVTAIELTYHWTGRHDRYGNLFRYEALTHTVSGTRRCYDIYFRSQ